MREVAALLGMDRTTLTAALKSLQRRGLVEVRVDENDKRSRRLVLTPAGRAFSLLRIPYGNLGYFSRGLLGSWPQADSGIVLWSLSVSAGDWQTSEISQHSNATERGKLARTAHPTASQTPRQPRMPLEASGSLCPGH